MFGAGIDANKKEMSKSWTMQVQEVTVPMEWMVKTSVTFRNGEMFGYLVVFAVDAGKHGRRPHAYKWWLQRMRRTVLAWFLVPKDERRDMIETRLCMLND
jgi:hypothetical protein